MMQKQTEDTHFMTQQPAPGSEIVMFRGDTASFSLTLARPMTGKAWLRTNIGHVDIARKEVVDVVDCDSPRLERDWFDIPMVRTDDVTFSVTLPLCEVGRFEAKGYFVGETDSETIWPAGLNAAVTVAPADTCCANIIYNAFVRQFGPNKNGGFYDAPIEADIDRLDRQGYNVIPPSGTFRDLIREIDFIVNTLGCRIIQLLPVHPTPTTYARMGRFGSPYAALGFTAVDPALAVFDPKATPLEQFIELVDKIHSVEAKVIIDIAINHTGWAARLHETHPEWLLRDPDGQIEVPGAWGVRWEDLTRLDYSQKGLWQYMGRMFLTWCRRGVDGFRCDAGYMIPVPAWHYIIAMVNAQFPDAIFFLEGLGGKVSATRELLSTAGFNWAYSELFQNYDRAQIEKYLPEAVDISRHVGTAVHFAETHDNDRLASQSREFARMRTALCALLSDRGAFGFTNGVEWYATEKIKVHESPSLNWGAAKHQIQEITRLCTLLKNHPAFFDRTRVKLIQAGEGNSIVLLRHNEPSGKRLLVVINLDDANPTTGTWGPDQTGLSGTTFFDLLSAQTVQVERSGPYHALQLGPAQVFCLTDDPDDVKYVRNSQAGSTHEPERILHQRLKATAIDVFRYYRGITDMGGFDLEAAARQLQEDPLAFCKQLNPDGQEPRVIQWNWPSDSRREVMMPPGHFLLVCGDYPFRAQITGKTGIVRCERSLKGTDHRFFTLMTPLPPLPRHTPYTLDLAVYTQDKCRHVQAPLLFLSKAERVKFKEVYRRKALSEQALYHLDTNGLGGMMRLPVDWGRLTSRYDALLSMNLNPDRPTDRWMLFCRCRAWIVYQNYSQKIDSSCFQWFKRTGTGQGRWRFMVPTGRGGRLFLEITAEMARGINATRLTFSRLPYENQTAVLTEDDRVKLILRPDIENRSFHHTTKAYLGPETEWGAAVDDEKDGFSFTPSGKPALKIRLSGGRYVHEPEWQYMVHRSADAGRGEDPDSDLFSPGYFSVWLKGGQKAVLRAAALSASDGETAEWASEKRSKSDPDTGEADIGNRDRLVSTMGHYLTKRDGISTVIAGFPWFQDWGRDSLMFARGLIAAGATTRARSVIRQFARFESDGTLPNMIGESGPLNYDTSDAPLWLFVAVEDLLNQAGEQQLLTDRCGSRTLNDVLDAIFIAFINGTGNGIRIDPKSGLIFSPAHFTWMDTDHPAGTPRQGYPVEIQALWVAALRLMSRIGDDRTRQKCKKLQTKVCASIIDLYWMPDVGYLSDCLHAQPGEPAESALKDDALRPNQLLAITLGAVTDFDKCAQMLSACQSLLVPGAVRSLADRQVQRPLEIMHQGQVLNDPANPYWGRYEGDEDTRRKPAYHNGTAWTWLLPVFCEAWSMVYGDAGRETAKSWLSSMCSLIDKGCIGHVPEIVDGDFPHRQRGCDAQAWGLSELVRVWTCLEQVRSGRGSSLIRPL